MTEYYLDADNGNDGSAGTAIGTAWKTFFKFTDTAVAGDLGTIRGDRAATYQLASPAKLHFTADGTISNPIRMEYDYDNQFSDHVDLSATATVTPTVGSKVWTYSADVSGVVAAGDMLYVSGDDNREFAYEVESVSTVTVTMYLRYKGAQAGSGKTSFNMQSMPKWGEVTDNFGLNIDGDNYWMFQGIHFRGSHAAGVFEVDAATSPMFRSCVFEGNGVGSKGLSFSDDWSSAIVVQCRFFNYTLGLESVPGTGGFVGEVRDCLFDGNSTAASGGANISTGVNARFIDCEFKNHLFADMYWSSTTTTGGLARLRNCVMASATEFDTIHNSLDGGVFVEDHDGTLNDTRQYSYLSVAEATPVIQSDTGTVRSGGNAFSILVTPSDDFILIKGWEHNQLTVFEIPFYATTASKTYTVYLRPNVTGNWTADPLASELWLQAEYWGHASNSVRIVTKSTEVIDMNGSTAWQALTVTVAPAQAGVLYLSLHYTKDRESAKTNLFFVDPKPVVS